MVSACDLVFGIPFRGDPDGAVGDTTRDGTGSPCVMSQEAFADFETPMVAVCTGIGAPNVAPPSPGEPPPLMRIEDGTLRVEPRPLTAEGNGCTVNEMLFGEGVFVEVSRIFAHPASSVFFRLFPIEPGIAVDAGFTATVGQVTMLGGGSARGDAPFVPNQWWRLRPDRLNDRVIGEVSPDGLRWEQVGEMPGAVPVTIKLVIGAVITDMTAATPGAAAFEQVNVCP